MKTKTYFRWITNHQNLKPTDQETREIAEFAEKFFHLEVSVENIVFGDPMPGNNITASQLASDHVGAYLKVSFAGPFEIEKEIECHPPCSYVAKPNWIGETDEGFMFPQSYKGVWTMDNEERVKSVRMEIFRHSLK